MYWLSTTYVLVKYLSRLNNKQYGNHLIKTM